MVTAINSPATTAATTSTVASLKEGTKKFLYMYVGSGAKDLGTVFHDAPKGTFKLGEAFNDCFTKHTAAVAAQKTAGTAVKTSLLKKMGGLFGKILGPAIMIVPELMNAYRELKNGGGIGGALKALGKGAINLVAYPITSFAVAALGITGGWAFAATLIGTILVGMATNKIATAVLGKTNTELIAEQQAQQGGQTETAGASNGGNQKTLASIDAQIQETDRFLKNFDLNSNSCLSTKRNNDNYDTSSNGNKRVFIA